MLNKLFLDDDKHINFQNKVSTKVYSQFKKHKKLLFYVVDRNRSAIRRNFYLIKNKLREEIRLT